MSNLKKKNKINMLDTEKLYAQYKAGLSIHQISIVWNIPYASLWRILKKQNVSKVKIK